MLMRREHVSFYVGSPLDKLWTQIALGLCSGVFLPTLFLLTYLGEDSRAGRGVTHSIVAASVAIAIGTLAVRRFASFPGTRAFMYIVPCFATSYGLAVASLLLARLEYNRLLLTVSFALALLTALLGAIHVARNTRRRFWLVPFGKVARARETSDVDWIVMTEPQVPAVPNAIVVADLQYDHDDDWSRMLAIAAVEGHEVYHTKVLIESLTGQVSMEHLSENSFGSLLTNLFYVQIKRAIDVMSVILLSPILLMILLPIAVVVKLSSQGPVIFIQERMGFRGIPFRMIKFRTMYVRDATPGEASRNDAMTATGDARITPIGRFLRRTRLDELPQVWHILRGEMSWIGPRPEAIPLSQWYEKEIPFYFYRHIVRPGISGWAQVKQGHVTDIESVSAKLRYDFYYIKNFSAWLDLLIVLKTMRTVGSGFGAR